MVAEEFFQDVLLYHEPTRTDAPPEYDLKMPAQLVDSVADVLAATGPQDGKVYVIANYTALPQVRAELNKLVVEAPAPVPAVAPVPAQAPAPVPAPATASTSAAEKEARS